MEDGALRLGLLEVRDTNHGLQGVCRATTAPDELARQVANGLHIFEVRHEAMARRSRCRKKMADEAQPGLRHLVVFRTAASFQNGSDDGRLGHTWQDKLEIDLDVVSFRSQF